MFQEAAVEYERAMRVAVSDHWAWYVRAALLAYLEHDYAYEAHCREMLARFGGATGRPAVRIAKACLLRPVSGFDLAALQKTAIDARARDLHPKDVAWDEMAIGMAEHRLNHPRAAVDHLTLCVKALQSTPGGAAADFYRAINLQRLGKTDEATQVFDGATRTMGELPSPGQGDLGESGIENWLIAQVAQREAAQALRRGK
jgi:hypothetical protein